MSSTGTMHTLVGDDVLYQSDPASSSTSSNLSAPRPTCSTQAGAAVNLAESAGTSLSVLCDVQRPKTRKLQSEHVKLKFCY